MIDAIIGIGILLFYYPANILVYALEQPIQMLGWLVIGIAVLLVSTSLRLWMLRRIWVALWFFPGAIICGAAALMPWPFALWSHFGPGNCAPVTSLLFSALLNVVVVLGVAEGWRRLRKGRQLHDKALQDDERDARA
jgi:hypothetical protein